MIPALPIVHDEVSLSKTLNPQLLPQRFTAAHCSLIPKDGSNAEKDLPTQSITDTLLFILINLRTCGSLSHTAE